MVVAQLVEQLHPTPEVRDSNPFIGKTYIEHVCQPYWKDIKIKGAGMVPFFKKERFDSIKSFTFRLVPKNQSFNPLCSFLDRFFSCEKMHFLICSNFLPIVDCSAKWPFEISKISPRQLIFWKQVKASFIFTDFIIRKRPNYEGILITWQFHFT